MDLFESHARCLQQSEMQVSQKLAPAAFAGRQARAPAAAANKRGGRGTGRGRGRAGAAAKPAPNRPAAGRGRGGPKAKQQKVHTITSAHMNTSAHGNVRRLDTLGMPPQGSLLVCVEDNAAAQSTRLVLCACSRPRRQKMRLLTRRIRCQLSGTRMAQLPAVQQLPRCTELLPRLHACWQAAA